MLSAIGHWWSARKTFRRLRRTSEDLFDRLDLPVGSGITTLIERLSRERRRPIQVLPVSLGAGEPCGMWLAMQTVDIIVVEADTTAFHRDHIIAHELAHMLCNHSSSSEIETDGLNLLFPHLDTGRVIDILGRTHYPNEEERAAEVVASLILERVTRPPRESRWEVPSRHAAVVARIDKSLRSTD